MTDLQGEGWRDFLTLIRSTDSTDLFSELCALMFTLEEKEQIALRVELVKELLKGEKTQRQISQDLNISIAKITRGSNALKTVSGELKAHIKKALATED